MTVKPDWALAGIVAEQAIVSAAADKTSRFFCNSTTLRQLSYYLWFLTFTALF